MTRARLCSNFEARIRKRPPKGIVRAVIHNAELPLFTVYSARTRSTAGEREPRHRPGLEAIWLLPRRGGFLGAHQDAQERRLGVRSDRRAIERRRGSNAHQKVRHGVVVNPIL